MAKDRLTGKDVINAKHFSGYRLQYRAGHRWKDEMYHSDRQRLLDAAADLKDQGLTWRIQHDAVNGWTTILGNTAD